MYTVYRKLKRMKKYTTSRMISRDSAGNCIISGKKKILPTKKYYFNGIEFINFKHRGSNGITQKVNQKCQNSGTKKVEIAEQ